ncbi:hypothetical protein N7517_007563 [Penicillium concentricum]|uniref:U4/U6.U5 small nuclear ribonucleoprotein 27kDa protein domain-containing protein n=1 Tax=Penicillium concentricum TaxID=293559 RepID=A0A9W9SCE5_9EURO|nr:uncharacterized protein N7517_007563 [Penicillium concentricum]KAJ5375557.1 hypothetical protein N7517_007563 [Penicillium concentricum]
MTEPPAKRARRADSSAMWDSNDKPPRAPEQGLDRDRRRSPAPRDDRRDGRYRSRSRERKDGRRERSWSRDRRDRDRRDGDKDGRGAQDRKRSTSRERNQDRRGNAPKSVKFRERSRSRSPQRNGAKARSPPRGPKSDRHGDRKDPRSQDGRKATGAQSGPERHEDEMDIDFNEDADEDEIEAQMRKAMGFSRFRTTKNTKIPGNNIYGVRKEKKIEYRQYMNRQGGFNRPLSPSR